MEPLKTMNLRHADLNSISLDNKYVCTPSIHSDGVRTYGGPNRELMAGYEHNPTIQDRRTFGGVRTLHTLSFIYIDECCDIPDLQIDSIVVILHDDDLEYALHIVLNLIGVLLNGKVVAFILVIGVIVQFRYQAPRAYRVVRIVPFSG